MKSKFPVNRMLSICLCEALVFIGACLCYGATSFWKPSSSLFLSATTAEIVHGKRRSFLRAGNVKSELPSLRVDMGSNIFHTLYNGHPVTEHWIDVELTTGCSKWMPLKKELWHQFTYLSCLQSACFWVLGSYNLPCTIHSFSCGKNLKLRL